LKQSLVGHIFIFRYLLPTPIAAAVPSRKPSCRTPIKPNENRLKQHF
jgi:hypothetical protein